MMQKSLLGNALFNFIKTLNSIVFPVITFAYSARILGVDGVGQVNFAKSFITYFVMIAMLGMNYYGTREAVKVRDDKEALSKFCVEMLFINGTTTLLAYGLLAASMLFIPMLRGYEALLLISSAAIVLQGMGMEWLYQALEEYRYIALRSTLFQILALGAMFLFVREQKDVLPYAAVTLLASSGSYVLNFYNARKYIQLKRDVRYTVKKHLKPLLLLFAMAVSIELYTVLDTTLLAFLQGDRAVGLYTAAVKVARMTVALLTALGAVIIPRLSYYISNHNAEEIDGLIHKAYNYMFMFATPAAVGLFILSDEIILLLSGSDFASAAFTLRLLAPIVVFIPFSVTTNQQTFIPMGREVLILFSTFIGAVVDFAINMFLIPRYGENGAAVATLAAESAVALVCFINANAQFQVRRVFKCYYQYWLAALPILLIGAFFRSLSLPRVMHIGLVVLFSALGYALTLFVLKNPYYCEAWQMLKHQLLKKGAVL